MILQNFVLQQGQGELTVVPSALTSYDLNMWTELPNAKWMHWHKNSSLCFSPTATPSHRVNTWVSTHCMGSPCHLIQSREI